jgi:large conductance mechanosensitive channel
VPLRIFVHNITAGEHLLGRSGPIAAVKTRFFFLPNFLQEWHMSMISEFKQFVVQGNVIDLAVGLLIGASFTNVVNAFSDGFIKPILTSFSPDHVALKLGIFDVGLFITALMNFMIVISVLFFVFVKPMNALKARMDKEEGGPKA